MRRVYAIEAWCVDCRRCEVACKTFHSKSKDTLKALLVEYPAPVSRIRVAGGPSRSVAVSCRHCERPACVEACISGAMTKNAKTGVVSVDPAQCVGCRTCVAVCPYGCVRVEELGHRAVALKCDACGEELGEAGEPRCVAACPNRALVYVESEGC